MRTTVRNQLRRIPFALLLALVVSAGLFTGGAAAAPYLGAGRFPSKSLNVRYYGTTADYYGSYITPARNAWRTWDYYTNLALTEVATSNFHALVYTTNWGNTGWNGYAYICSTNGYCNNQYALGGWYWYCHARINTYALWSKTQTQRQQTIAHELGHCWSLAHRLETTSVMYPTGPTTVITPNYYDRYYVNQRYR